jgi:hypothetical protein
MSIVTCPHCNDQTIIEKLNCGIFRHGSYKLSGKQIDPHTSKEVCDDLINNNLIYGCGKPFKIVIINDIFIAEICEYI